MSEDSDLDVCARLDALRPPIAELGAYRLRWRLGSGGMAEVFLARPTEPDMVERTGGDVALKVLREEVLAAPGMFRRFLTEAAVGRDIAHPNVVRVHGAGVAPTPARDVGYLVMEFAPGGDLRQRISPHAPPSELAVRALGVALASGLEAVHAAGVSHGDLKPENILHDAEGVPKLADFGLARLQRGTAAIRSGFEGSLLYAAPEAIARGPSDAAPRADLWSLGAILFEYATGTHPCAISDEPPSVAASRQGLSAQLAETIGRLLRTDPAERFRTAADLADALRRPTSGATPG